MSDYRHHVTGFFAGNLEAETALSRLVEKGLPRQQIHIFKTEPPAPEGAAPANSDAVLKDIVVDSAVGTAVGTGIGALAQLTLVAANLSLFIASPLISTLVMLGWGASLGGLVGAAAGVATGGGSKEARLSDLIRDAISHGLVVLVAETRTEGETETARTLIEAAVGPEKSLNTL